MIARSICTEVVQLVHSFHTWPWMSSHIHKPFCISDVYSFGNHNPKQRPSITVTALLEPRRLVGTFATQLHALTNAMERAAPAVLNRLVTIR
jgi:hypothetical protein